MTTKPTATINTAEVETVVKEVKPVSVTITIDMEQLRRLEHLLEYTAFKSFAGLGLGQLLPVLQQARRDAGLKAYDRATRPALIGQRPI